MIDMRLRKELSKFPTNIDRRLCERVVPMRVLCLGLSRTGTESLRKALIELGYTDTYHGYEAAVENPRDCEMWFQALRAKYDGVGPEFTRADWDQLLGHCQAVCDVPAACFAEELMLAYPDAKVILTNRDVNEWHASVSTTLIAGSYTMWAKCIDFLATWTRSPNRWTRPTFLYTLSDFFDGDFEKNGKPFFKRHYEMVREVAAETKVDLLEYRIEQGWEPLCEFLGHPIPKEPFPCGNSKVVLRARIRAIVNVEVRRLLSILLVLLAMVAMVFVGIILMKS